MKIQKLIAATMAFVIASAAVAADPKLKSPSKQELMMEAIMKFGPPGPEHKSFEPLPGTWTVKMRMWNDPSQPAIESDGTLTRKAILGGRFIQEDYAGSVMGQPYHGIGTMGYDRAKKQYLSTWMDDMSTSMMDAKGTYDATTKTWTFGCDESCPLTGDPIKVRHTLQIVGPDEQKMVMYRKMGSEPETKCMELLLTRKK